VKPQAQITSHIMMVRPANFGYNEETAANNAFQTKETTLTNLEIKNKAVLEFDGLVQKLMDAGVNIYLIEDIPSPVNPDAVFPNNWVSFHENGTVITYPMFAPVRRNERREEILEKIREDFEIIKRLYFEYGEKKNKFLEGTGSMVIDRQNQIVYACRSVRTNEEMLDHFCEELDVEEVLFDAVDENGMPIYHTNVMMALGETFVVICLDTIRDINERHELLERFEETDKEVIEISLEQMSAFAGNMLQVRNNAGESILVMSQQAFESLDEEQIEQIESHTQILYSDISTIEKFGGGSARCMIAEIFLPVKE
jgi:hypothetical protein